MIFPETVHILFFKEHTHKAWPLPPDARILFFKAEVKGHLRRLANGKVITVRPYHNRRSKKADESHHDNGSHEPSPPPDWERDVQRQMAAVVARYTLPDGTKAPGWLKAPNGEPTKLTEGQWVQVRTENFKRWFGDWEAAAKAKILQGAPVATLTGHEPPTGGYAEVRKWAAALFHRQGGMARNPQLGAVILDERSVRDSLAHGGANQYKKAAFAAVKDVIEKGVMINSHHEKNEDSFYISAPVLIHEKNNIVTALVHRDVNTQRMYLHSVMAKESLQDRGVSSADAEAPKRSGSTESEGNKRILQELLNFNFADVSKVIDAHGEPLVVYHGTQKEVPSFEQGHASENAYLLGKDNAIGFFFDRNAGTPSDQGRWQGAAGYAGTTQQEGETLAATGAHIIPVFLNLKAPWRPSWDDYREFVTEISEGAVARKQAEALGYDSILVGDDLLIAFSPTQIKSALGNRGTFDPADAELVKTLRLPSAPRILFFKAIQHALFDTPIVVPGHTRASTGTFVAPYASHRKKRLELPKTSDLFGATAQPPARTDATATTKPEGTLQATSGQVNIKPSKRPVAEGLLNQASTGGAGGGSRSGNGGGGGKGDGGRGNGNGDEPPSLFNFSSSEIPADKNDSHVYRITAQAIAQPRYANKSPVPVTVKATQEPVWVSWRGIKHVLRDGNPTWQESLAALHVEALLESATKIAIEPDRFGRKDPIAIHRYQTIARFDGEAYQVILVVREHTDGKRYYDHSVITAKTPAGLPASPGQNAAPTEPAPPFTGAVSTIPPVAPADKPPASTFPVQAPLKNYGWDAVKLANVYSLEELNQLREHVETQHANPKIEGRYFENGSPTLFLYDRKGRKKLESLSWAVYNKMKEHTHKAWPLPPNARILFLKAA